MPGDLPIRAVFFPFPRPILVPFNVIYVGVSQCLGKVMPIDDCPDRLADERTAFHQLFVKNQRQVFAYILTLLPRMSDAEEVFQQACVVILGKASQFKASQVAAGADFFRWACQIAKYEVYNYRRRRATQQVCFSDALLDQLAARRLEGGDALEAELDALRRCVDILPPADRELIRQRYARRVTSRALALELGRPESSVYKAIHRIRRLLRECVERAVAQESQAAPADARKTGQPSAGARGLPAEAPPLPRKEERP
jgi:RNA polymerase sigma-70 factor (ECF subfamily)